MVFVVCGVRRKAVRLSMSDVVATPALQLPPRLSHKVSLLQTLISIGTQFILVMDEVDCGATERQH